MQEGCQSRDFFNLRKQLTLINKIYPECDVGRLLPMLEETITLLGEFPVNTVEIARQLLPGFVQDAADDILKKIGILCITKVIENKRMWEEYADNANGFVVEYDGLDSLFVGDETGVFDRIRDVDYVGERLSIRLSACDFERLFYTKLAKYEFEKESRVIKVLSECDDEFGFVRISPERFVKRVIVGWNCSEENFAKIKEVVAQQSDCSIPVVRAFFADGHVQIS